MKNGRLIAILLALLAVVVALSAISFRSGAPVRFGVTAGPDSWWACALPGYSGSDYTVAVYPDEAALLANEGLSAPLRQDTNRIENRYEAAYGYSDGTFVMDGTVTFTDGTWLTEPVPYKLFRTMKTTLTTGELDLGDLVVFPYEDWPYGTLLLALGNDRALIVADQADAFVVVEVLGTYYGDVVDGEVHMTRDHIQAIADSFAFDRLAEGK